jgi:hypothetical protein
MTLRPVRLGAVALLACILPGFGATITYSTASEFAAAMAVQLTEDFETAIRGSYGAEGLIIGDLQFIGYNGYGGYLLNIVSAADGIYYDWGTGKMLQGPDPVTDKDRRIHMNFSNIPGGGIFAFGFNLMMYGASGGASQIRLSTGETLTGTVTASWPTQVFWGVSSDTPIVYAELLSTTAGGYPMIDNFMYGTTGDSPGEVAELMTLLYVGSGLLLLRALARLAQIR